MSDLTDIVSAMGGYQAATQQDKDALELVLGTRGGRQRTGGGIPPIGGLQPPIANPATARTIGPTTVADTGWQDMGGVEQTAHFEAAVAGSIGAFSEGGEFYLGCDTNDGNPTIGVKYNNLGSNQYPRAYYRKDGAWVSFQFNRGDQNFGRAVLLEDKIDYGIDKGAKTFSVRFNGQLQVNSQGATSSITESFFAPAFPNGPGRYARYVRTSGTGLQSVTLAGGVVTPLVLRSADLDVDTRVLMKITYTGTPVGYLSRRLDTAGGSATSWAPAALVTNPSAGEATYRTAQVGVGPGTSSIFELVEAQDATTPKAGATAVRITMTSPTPVMFGINLQLEGDFFHNQISNQKIGSWRNHFGGGNNYNLRSWTEANPQMDQNGQPTQAAMQQIAADNATTDVITGVNASPDGTPTDRLRRGNGSGNCGSLCIVAGRKVMQRNRVIWDGPQSMGSLSDLYGIAKSVQTGTNGTQSWIDFDHAFDPTLFTKRDPIPQPSFDNNTVRVDFKMVNGVGPSNVKVYEIVSQSNTAMRSTGIFDADYVTDSIIYRGHALYPFRFMDVQNIINQYNQIWSAAHVSETTGPQFGQFAWSYPRCLAFMEATSAGGQICYPLQADETFVRKVANMCAVWSARTKLHIAHELSNENWNPGQFSYHKLVKLGQDAGDTSTDNAAIARKQHAKMSTQIMKWITDEYSKVAGASAYLHRIINVQNATTGNTAGYATFDQDFLTYHDEYQVAPYLAGGLANNYPSIYADITDAHLDDFINKIETVEIPKVYGWAATNRDYAKSVNKRLACYEGLFEDIGNAAFQRKLKNDPIRWPYLIKLLFDQWGIRVGGLFRGYIDNGFTYGYRAHVSQSPDGIVDGAPQAIGWKTAKEYIASKPTI